MLVLTTCMECGSKFNSGAEGYSEYFPEENHWEAICDTCIVENRDILPDDYSSKSDIDELRELLAEDPFTNAVGVEEDNLPF